ncbi:MAG TPA: MlaD family protein [Gemmatimonadaceae bacterium]|nr:MlaD family protein [Gemmatimonadaceae bacterium]
MKRASDAVVGLVVLVVALATITAITWARQADIGGRRQLVVAHFRDVGNARVGNAVVIRGVVGGRIQAIELAPDGWVNVRMRLDPAVGLPAHPVVLLNESSLFGDWQATVVDRSALPADGALHRAVEDASHDSNALPGTSLPGIGKLTTVAGQIAGDVASVASRVGTAFDDSAARELRSSIKNVADLSATLRSIAQEHASDLDTLSDELRAAMLTLARTATSVEQTAQRLDSATTSDQARQLVDNFDVASIELRRAAVQVHDLSRRLVATEGRIDAVLANGNSVLAKIDRGQGSLGLLVNDPSLYRRADSTLAELRALAAALRANPKKYISVRLF